MAETFLLEITTPERLLLSEEVTEAQIPAENGYMGILPGHAPVLAILGPGELEFTAGGRRRSIAVSSGYVEVMPHRVRVLADTAERAEEIDIRRAEEAYRRAMDRLAHPDIALDIARALSAAQKARARLAAAHKI